MKKISEKLLTSKVKKYLDSIPGCHVIRYIPAPGTTRGISDFLLCYRGLFVAIELKVGNNQPTQLQKFFIKRITAIGGVAVVCRSLDEVKALMKMLDFMYKDASMANDVLVKLGIMPEEEIKERITQ